MKINIPWKALNTVKRYVITTVPSFINSRPNDHVRPRRHRRANAPRTQDLMFSNLLESGFKVFECFTILHNVITRKIRFSRIIKVTGPMKLQIK